MWHNHNHLHVRAMYFRKIICSQRFLARFPVLSSFSNTYNFATVWLSSLERRLFKSSSIVGVYYNIISILLNEIQKVNF